MSDSTPEDKLPRYTPEQLREIRVTELKITSMEKMAEEIGYSRSTIQRYESGNGDVTPEYIRDFERLRAKIRAERAQQAIDFSSIKLSPGRQLVKLVPESRVDGDVPDIYLATPKPPPNKGGSPGSPEVPTGGPITSAPSGQVTTASAGSSRAESGYDRQIMTFQWTLSRTLVLFSIWGREQNQGEQSPRPSRWRGPLGRLAIAASLAVVLPIGCFQTEGLSQRAIPPALETLWAAQETAQPPLQSQQQKPLRSFKGQKEAPCNPDEGEIEADKFCWYALDPARPCPSWAEKRDGQCLEPVRAKPKRPSTVTPE